MTNLTEKLRRKEKPTSEDWVDYLKHYHAEKPGRSTIFFRDALAPESLSSYEMLIETISEHTCDNPVVLDLACGDGSITEACLNKFNSISKIVAVDMSESELNVAKTRINSDKVEWKCETAQNLSLTDNSINFVLCHMALMLMNPIEPVITEIHRVLKPGGVLSGVVNNPSGAAGFMKKFYDLSHKLASEDSLDLNLLEAGNTCFYSEDGVQKIFHESSGFHNIKTNNFYLIYHDLPEKIATLFSNLYVSEMLSPESKNRLVSEAAQLFSENTDDQGRIRLELPLKKITVQKMG